MANARIPQALKITGRFVGGSVYNPKTHDEETKERFKFKSGRLQGQNQDRFSVGLAVLKTKGHFSEESGWGPTIWTEGHTAWPQGQAQQPTFSWKVSDGDSTIPNSNGKRPCDQPGYAGHWILWFTSMFEEGGKPQVAVAVGTPAVWNGQPGLCMPGDYIEVDGSVVGNESAKKPGVYLNLGAVCLRAYHAEGRIISQKVDLSSFGSSALPAGAVMQPVGNAVPPAPPVPAAPPTTPGAPPVPATPVPAPSAAPVPTPSPVVPNPEILGAPAPVVAPPPPVVAPPAPVAAPPATLVMLNGGDYKAHKDAGWTDEMMREKGWL